MSDKHEIDSLSKHYQRRKAQHKAPSAIRQRLFERKQAISQRHIRSSWLKQSLAFCAVGAIFIVLYLNIPVFIPSNTGVYENMRYASIELHVVDQQLASFNATQRVKYADAQSAFTQGEVAFSKVAKVLSQDQGLSLLTCQNELIKITEEVLKLNTLLNEKTNAQVDKGMLVQINYTNSGQIMELKQKTSSELDWCPEGLSE